MNAHRLFEDFEVGLVIGHHWGRTVTETDAVLFATQTHLYQPANFNAVVAEHDGRPGPAAPELLVFAVVLGLSVEDLSESGGPFLGADDIRHGVPVLAGDTLWSASRVVSRRPSESRPGWGVVRWRTIGVNQRGEEVVSYERTSLVRRRTSSQPSASEDRAEVAS
jgi:itaconyl-CoA hydratase